MTLEYYFEKDSAKPNKPWRISKFSALFLPLTLTKMNVNQNLKYVKFILAVCLQTEPSCIIRHTGARDFKI